MTFRLPWPAAVWTLVAGLILVVIGFAAAFTVVGAVTVFLGLGCTLAGVLALVRLPMWLSAGAGVVAAAVLLVQFALTGP